MPGINRDKDVLLSLITCAHAFLQFSDFSQSAQTVYECWKELIGATAGYVALLSEDKSRQQILYTDMDDPTCNQDLNLSLPLQELQATALSSGAILYENNCRQSEWLQHLPEGHGSLANILFAPLVLDGATVALFAFAGKPGGFNEQDALVCRAFAELAAIGLLQNRTLARLKKNARHLSALMQTAHDAIITVDRQGSIFFWNKAAENCFGYSAEEIIGTSCLRIVPEKYRQAHSEAFDCAVAADISVAAGHWMEVEGLRKNKETFPAELSLSKWMLDDAVFFTGIVRDISQRKRMEREIVAAEKRLREVFKHMKGGGGIYQAVDHGKDFVFVDFHRPALPGLDENNADLTGRRILDVFPSCRDYGLFDVLQRVWRTGEAEIHPVRIYDGEEIAGWRENYVFKLQSGEVVALYDDFTEQKKMERALIESESLFRTIFETSPDPINITRLEDGKFIKVNRRFLELTGYGESEITGRTAMEIGLWHDPEKRRLFYSLLLQKGQIKNFEGDFRRKDGFLLTALVSAEIISYHKEPHILAVTQDITELKKAAQDLLEAHRQLEKRFEVRSAELKESEIKYSTLVEALLTGVYMCVDGQIIFVNRQFAEIFGYSRDELLDMNLHDLIHPDDREFFTTLQDNDTAADNDHEFRGLNRRGETIYLLGRKTVVDHQGRQAVLGNVANISVRKQAEQARLKTEEELRILSAQLLSAEERERKRIARDIHDSIGQALSAIKFSVENALDAIGEQSPASAGQTLENILPLTRHTIEEVRRIIMDLRPSTLDDLGLIATISWFCREFETIFSPVHIEKEIEVEEQDIPPALKIVIYRIVQEAMNNAAKHSRTDCIRLHLGKKPDTLELLIEDAGQGFDVARFQSRITDHKGMGLASMKERAQLSGGIYTMRSSPGTGTTIRVSWPVKTED